MSDIFLSYSREDLATARRFAQAFEREGFTVWWDQSLDAGEAFDHVTEKALEEARAVVVLWSTHAVQSRWVRAEATQADRARKLVPVEIEFCKRPIMFELTQTASLAHWNGNPSDASWQALVAGLRRQIGKAVASPAADAGALPAFASPSRKTLGFAIGIAALLVAGIVAFMLLQVRERPDVQSPVAIATQAPPVTLAVLPFANLSSEPEQEYFSDGLTEEILNQLAQVKALSVTGRTSSFAFKGKNEDLRVIGEKLGVANLLEGSVRKSGKELRITAQLINARDGTHIWSQSYERPIDDVFEVQESVAKDVAKALSIKLEVGELAGRPGMTRDIEAYDAYLASIALTEPDPESLRSAMAQLERATALDPKFVDAWIRLANVYAFASTNLLPGNTREGWAAKADAVIERIRGISDYGQVVYEGLSGDRSHNAWAMVDAQKHFENAVTLARKQGLEVSIVGNDAVFVIATGRIKEAIALLERGKARDPLNTFVSFLLSKAYAAAGNLPAAIAEEDRGLKVGGFEIPLRGSAVFTALATRDRKLIEQRLALTLDAENDPNGFNAAMKARLEKPVDALAEVRRRAATSTNQTELSLFALWLAWLGDPQGALDIYRGHADFFRTSRRNAITFDIWSPVMSDMRKLPGFKLLAREMGLVDYWRAYGWADLCKPVGTDDFECT